MGGNSLSDLLVFGKRAGDYAAKFANERGATQVSAGDADRALAAALAPFERSGSPEAPYKIQHELQEMMQDLVGIVRREDEMKRALDGVHALRARARQVGVAGNREYNPGWHTALDLDNLLTISEAITLAAIERRESRGGHFRDDYPDKDKGYGAFNIVLKRGSNGEMVLERRPQAPLPDELKSIIEEQAK